VPKSVNGLTRFTRAMSPRALVYRSENESQEESPCPTQQKETTKQVGTETAGDLPDDYSARRRLMSPLDAGTERLKVTSESSKGSFT
jgi:hypothetical protein